VTRWQRFLCRMMGWHRKPYAYDFYDGASVHARCTRCGLRGMVDSQGNLF
jgi:hypothetical protein